MQTFIYIATTQGPVRVQAITEEDPDIKSVVCLDGLAEPLAISDRYHDFVKKGTGLIHREFGHGSYRVDVGKPIDRGDSWQLGLYCAHVLHKNNLLCNELPKRGDRVVIVTGRVKSNGEITAVDKIPEKSESAAKQVTQWRNLGCDVVGFFPEKQLIEPHCLIEDDQYYSGIHYLNNIDEIPRLLMIDKKESAQSQVKKIGFVMGIVCLSLIISYFSVNQGYEGVYRLDVRKGTGTKERVVKRVVQGEGSDNALTLIVHIADEGAGCGQGAQKITPVVSDYWFETVSFDRLCRVEYRANSTEFLFAFSLDRLGMIALERNHNVWSVPLPLDQRSDRSYVLITLLGEGRADFEVILQKQLLRWGLLGKGIRLSDVSTWIKKQSIKADVYGHVLSKGK